MAEGICRVDSGEARPQDLPAHRSKCDAPIWRVPASGELWDRRPLWASLWSCYGELTVRPVWQIDFMAHILPTVSTLTLLFSLLKSPSSPVFKLKTGNRVATFMIYVSVAVTISWTCVTQRAARFLFLFFQSQNEKYNSQTVFGRSCLIIETSSDIQTSIILKNAFLKPTNLNQTLLIFIIL